MNVQEALEKLLPSFRRYYNVKTEDVAEPFAAEAVFQSHNEQYFLIKSARISEANSNEFAYFYTADSLNAEELKELDRCAWERGTENVQPNYYHRSTDVALIILAEKIDEEAKKLMKKLNHSKSYQFGLQGYSNYRLVALELSTGKVFHNRQGQNLKKLVGNIIK
ncbi:MAG: hypothetical protein E7286_07640 [Lachnospiraceae bacterium]|nr:hypothetical protein [Lachnospiraceae bacterium]